MTRMGRTGRSTDLSGRRSDSADSSTILGTNNPIDIGRIGRSPDLWGGSLTSGRSSVQNISPDSFASGFSIYVDNKFRNIYNNFYCVHPIAL